MDYPSGARIRAESSKLSAKADTDLCILIRSKPTDTDVQAQRVSILASNASKQYMQAKYASIERENACKQDIDASHAFRLHPNYGIYTIVDMAI